ncbi:MAG: hypothetical protein JWQ94_4606 [Tardiphaga sp.]|nr:hypothetical protein [Tardiphaga sp.]
MLIGTSNYTSGYLRFAPPVLLPSSAPADAPSNASASTDTKYGQGIKVSDLKQIPGVRFLSVDDVPGLRDRMAKNALTDHVTPPVTNDVFQNTYADVQVDGKVVATVRNNGTAVMTNEAAETIGNVADPTGLTGPDLAQWRADAYASLLGGSVEKATPAIAPSQSMPPQASYAALITQTGASTDFSA